MARLMITMTVLMAAWLATAETARAGGAAEPSCPALLDHEAHKLHSSQRVDLCTFSGRPLLLVNTASYCGFTRQFEGLQALYERYADRGLEVIGFPSNDFRQEADDEATTAEVCRVNYGVRFTMLSPSAVSGDDANPVFAEIARQGAELPRWNFHKYVVDGDGRVTASFGSRTEPDAEELRAALEAVLAGRQAD